MICPKCNTNNVEGAKFCGKCGTELIAPQVPQRVFCSQCGKENLGGSSFCGYCGSPLVTNPQQTQRLSNDEASDEDVVSFYKKNRTALNVVGAIIIVVFLFALCIQMCGRHSYDYTIDYSGRYLGDVINYSNWYYEDIEYVNGVKGRQASLTSNNSLGGRHLKIEYQYSKNGIFLYLICPDTKYTNKRSEDYVVFRCEDFSQELKFKWYERDKVELRLFATDKMVSYLKTCTSFKITYPCIEGYFNFEFSVLEPLNFDKL